MDVTSAHPVPYDSEAVLQELLVRAPEVLGAVVDDLDLLLVAREAGVPSNAGGGDHWAVDHVFLDAAGIPTLVEVKRSTDSRIRREVVGQMLDYAANGLRYWPEEDLRTRFEARCAAEGTDPDTEIAGLCGDVDPETYWSRVRSNLRAGKLRLVFVADHLPDELTRVIEFLNEQMSSTEVLGLELVQFEAGPNKTYVPRVVGRTAQAESSKGNRSRATYVELLEGASEEAREADRLLSNWFSSKGIRGFDRPKSRIWRPAHGIPVSLWLSWEVVAFKLTGLPSPQPDLLMSLQELTTKRLTDRDPSLPCADVVARWDDLREAVLEPFVAS